MEYQPVFVIRRNGGRGNDYCDYAAHGEMAGVSDAIGYDETAHARKFRTAEEAQEFIRTELPVWGRDLHHPVEVTLFDLMFNMSPLYAAKLQKNVEISDELLKPTQGRLLIWRR